MILPEFEKWFNIQSMAEDAPAESVAPAGARSGYAKSRETRARILAAALAEASESGFHKTSVAAIAARAGVAIGNLHYHFGSRSELIRELMGSLASDLIARLQAAAADDPVDFFEHQRSWLRAYLHYMRENPAYVRLVDEIKVQEPELYRRAVAGWWSTWPSGSAWASTRACSGRWARPRSSPGTWYWNRYPGAACDIESYVYLPLLEELGLRAHARSTPRRPRSSSTADGHRRASSDSTETRCSRPRSKDHASGTRRARRWTHRPPTAATPCTARFVIMANGPLHEPAEAARHPRASTISKGHTFHTSRWDYDYTGGDTTGNLVGELRRQAGRHHRHRRHRGAVRALTSARGAKHLYVFQRTPSSIDVRDNRPTDPDWAAGASEAGWHQQRHGQLQTLLSIRRLPGRRPGGRTAGPRSSASSILQAPMLTGEHRTSRPRRSQARLELADFDEDGTRSAPAWTRSSRTRPPPRPSSPGTASSASVPCFHDDYLQTFNRPRT